jgi:hypothetical protein
MNPRAWVQAEKMRALSEAMRSNTLAVGFNCRMKTMTKVSFSGASAVLLSALLQSCATSTPPTTAGGRAQGSESIVCPQCKMVAVATFPPYQSHAWVFASPSANFYPGWSSFGWGGLSNPQKAYEDKCPGCHGAITTFAREGKLKHKCSICSEKPFKCPVFHPEA